MQHTHRILRIIIAAAAFAACSELPTDATAVRSGSSIRVVNAHLESGTSTILGSGKRLTPYYCSVVSLAKDGRYKKTTLWLKIPESMKAKNGATQSMLFEWRVTDGGSPLSGAFCKIPNTPNAVDHLLAKVLFIDPKTMKGNSTNSTHTASMMMAADTYTLTPVVVFAVPTWTADMAGSSFSYYNDLSVPSWNDPGTGSYYDVPGDACDDPNNPNASGLIISAPSSPLMTDPVDACEKNRSGSAPFYCIDIYIAACNVGGLQGDCRNADPNAPASGSRAQIRFPETLGGGDPAVYLHETCITGFTLCTSPLGPPDNNVSIAYMGTDSIAVTFHLTNSMTSAGGRVGTPSIDGSVVFVKGDYGIFWPVAGSRDAFPSMSVYYQYQYGQIQLLQRDEQNFFNLIDHFGWTDNWQLCVPQ